MGDSEKWLPRPQRYETVMQYLERVMASIEERIDAVIERLEKS